MKKRNNLRSSIIYLVISLCLCGGLIMSASNDTTVARKEFEDIVEGKESVVIVEEEEVPLGAPKVTTKTTTKVTTQRQNMAKAASKSASKTSRSTKKSSKTSKTSSKKTVKDTTVVTTKVTSTKKDSKVKTIRTTVKTTVKTTVTSYTTTKTTSSSSSEYFEISSLSDIKSRVDSKVYNSFVNLGFTYSVNKKLSSAGVFSVMNHSITLKTANGNYLLHELGHFVAALKDNADSTSEWKAIYNEEKQSYTGTNKNYVTSTAAEYFAEAFRDYSNNPSALKNARPKTYNYIAKTVNSIDVDKDVNAFYQSYGWYWNMYNK